MTADFAADANPSRSGRMPARGGRPLRVLQVCARFLPDMGGIETHVSEVARRLGARDDIDMTVLTTDRSRRRTRAERGDGFTIRRIPAWPRKQDFYIAPQLYDAVRSGNWDVVHCQGVHTAVPVLALIAARRSGIPSVLTFHTGGHSSSARNAMRSLQWKAMGRTIRGAAHCIAVSRFEAETFIAGVGVERDRVSVVGNGGGLPAPTPGVVPVPGKVMSVGRLERYKGHQRVVEALPYLRRLMPGAHLEILGAGPMAEELRGIAARLGVPDAVSIRHVPPGDRLAMADALASANVIAAFSDYEAHPIAVIESLAIGRPVVGYDVAGIGDLVADGLVTGVAPGTGPSDAALAMAEAMCRPAPDHGHVPTWDNCVDRVLEVYRKVTRPADRTVA